MTCCMYLWVWPIPFLELVDLHNIVRDLSSKVGLFRSSGEWQGKTSKHGQNHRRVSQ